MSTKTVGLDLGAGFVKACELVTTFRNFDLTGFGTEPVESEPGSAPSIEAIAQAARRLLERRKLLDETLMCALPAEHVSTVALEFPFSQPKKIEQVLPFQLEGAVPFDSEEIVYDYQITSQTEGGGVKVLVAYVQRTVLERFLEALQTVGIDPKVVSVGALSYFNLYDAVIGEEVTDSVAILDLGHVHSELVIFDEGQPSVARNIVGGGFDVTAALADAFTVDFAQAERGKQAEGLLSPADEANEGAEGGARRALISRTCRQGIDPVLREVKRSLVAHNESTGQTIRQIYLTGGTSNLTGIAAYVERVLGVPAALLDPLDVPFNRLTDDADRLRPFAGKGLAISLRAFQRAHQSQINFRKGDYAYTGDFGFLRGRMITIAVSLVLIIVLAAAVAVSKKRVLEAERRTLNNQVRAVSQLILDTESTDVDHIFRVITAAEKSDARYIPLTSAFEILYEISNRVEKDLAVDVNRIEIDIERKKLEMTGKTASGGDVERIVEALKSYKCFKNRVTTDKVEKTMDERTKFRLSAASTCS